MANVVYTSPPITTLAAKRAAYGKVKELFQHLEAGTGGYDATDYVSSDFNISTPNKVTITLTNPLPDQNADGAQVTRYNLTRIA